MYKVLYHLIYWVFRPQTEMSKIKGLDLLDLPKNGGGFILVANHQNSHDPLILLVALKKFLFGSLWPKKIYFIGSLSLKKQWFRYNLISIIFSIFKETGYLEASRLGLKKAITALGKGNVVVIFPEGKRNPQPILAPGKRGAAVLALLSGKKIVPVGCFGPATEWLGQITGFFKKKWVVFGQPFVFSKLDQSEIDKNPEILFQTTEKIMEKISMVCGKTVHKNVRPRCFKNEVLHFIFFIT